MRLSSFHLLRVGLAITFLWIGLLILREPEAWGGFLQPWAMGLLPVPLTEAMIGTAVLDMVIGALLLVDSFVWLAALVGSLHLAIVLAVSGITEVTVRDIGLLAGTVALVVEGLPAGLRAKFTAWAKRENQPRS